MARRLEVRSALGSPRPGLAGPNPIPVLLGEDAQAIADALLDALRSGATEEDVAGAVAHAAALRIAQFPTSNEFGDWDTAMHTFTFANAVQQGLARSPSVELLRGVFDAAMSVYLVGSCPAGAPARAQRCITRSGGRRPSRRRDAERIHRPARPPAASE